jgi:hypothetical protein
MESLAFEHMAVRGIYDNEDLAKEGVNKLKREYVAEEGARLVENGDMEWIIRAHELNVTKSRYLGVGQI